MRSRAADYFQKGDYTNSAAEYRKALELEPDNPSIQNYLGDIYVKLHNIDDAVSSYLEAIKGYRAEALFNNAIAVCKKVLRLRKDDPEVYKTLGELYIQQGLTNEAIANLLEYAERRRKGGNPTAARDIYLQIIDHIQALINKLNVK